MSYDGGRKGTLRKGGHNVRQVADGHYNANSDNVCRASDFGTINPRIRAMYPMSKRTNPGRNDPIK